MKPKLLQLLRTTAGKWFEVKTMRLLQVTIEYVTNNANHFPEIRIVCCAREIHATMLFSRIFPLD